MEKTVVKKYIYLFSNLSLDNINEFDDIISKDIIFIDPFNNIKGINAFKKIFVVHKPFAGRIFCC